MPKSDRFISEERLDKLAGFVKEYRCPDCKSWALYVKAHRGERLVLCRKCAFRMELSEFAHKHMGYRTEGDTATVEVPDFLGAVRTVEL